MKVLIFQAAVAAQALAAMNRFAKELRDAGHQAGIRSLPHFRREKEPADRIFVALTPVEAQQFKALGAELVQTFVDAEKFTPVQLPEDPEELAEFDFSSAISELEDDTAGFMTLDQVRAEAIERGLEVTAQSTREHLEHLIGIDIHAGRQAADRITDAENANPDNTLRDRIGLRVSTVLPATNGMDLERMNDEQLLATAAQLGINVPKNVNRNTLINKMTKTFAKKVAAPEDSPVKSPAETVEADHDLAALDETGLKRVAEQEKVDLGRTSSKEGMVAKITEARQKKASESGDEL